MSHDDVRHLAALYAVGALVPEERASIDAHVVSCASCAAEVQSMVAAAAAFAENVPQVDPPASLRDRVLTHATGQAPSATAIAMPPRRSSATVSAGWLAAAAMFLAATAAVWYAARIRSEVTRLDAEVRDAVARANRAEAAAAAANGTTRSMQARLAVLTAPDLRQVELAGQAPAPQASARAFWSSARGVVFAAANLPPLPSGRTYQLWYLTGSAPVSAGIFKPDDTGAVTTAFDSVGIPGRVTGLAVSIEPDGGVPLPTGALYLAGSSAQ